MPDNFLPCSPTVGTKYIGSRAGAGILVLVQTQTCRERLKPRLDLIQHSPPGFDWAHTGSGAAQLALALLAHASGNDQFALKHYQVFKHEIIARLPRNGWQISSEQVLQMLRFVCCQGTQSEVQRPQEASAKNSKTAVVHAVLPTRDRDTITARGSAHNVGDAVARAVRNLFRDVRLRRRPILSLQMELSVVNVGNSDDRASENAQG
jgi:Family of unknown function (DUF6166)